MANESLQRRVHRFMNHWVTEICVAVLIVGSVALLLVEAALEPSHPYFDLIVEINYGITVTFAVELSLRFYGHQKKSTFFRRYWYDLLALIPLFRVARFLRVFRLLRVFRFGVIAIRRLSRVTRMFRYVRVEYVIVGFLALTVVLMGGLSMRYVEPGFDSLVDAMWFSLMTLVAAEPIGADPGTTFGKVVTVSIMLGGMTVFAVLIGTVSAVMVDTFRRLQLKPMALDDLEQHVLICGWNQAGPLVLEELVEADRRFENVVIVSERDDLDQLPIIQSHPSEVFTVQGDYTRVDVLQDAGIERASYAILLADSTIEERSSQDRDARSVLAAMLIEKINPGIYTTVQLLNRDNESSLAEIGVEEIIVSDEYVGNIMATVTKNRGIVAMLDELLTAKWGHQFYKDPVPEEFVGREVGDVLGPLKDRYDATLLGVDLQDPNARRSILVNPPRDLVLESEYRLFVTAEMSLTDGRRNR